MTNEQIQALKAAEIPLGADQIGWLHEAAEEHAAVGLKMTMKPGEMVQITRLLLDCLAEREADKTLIAEQTKYIERLREWNAGLAQESLDHQQRIADTDDALCKLLPGVQYMDPPDGGNVTPLEQVSRMVADYRQQIAELSTHLRNAHAFIENTEAFGGEAATGIIKCGGAEWNIDASKSALVSSPTLTVKLPEPLMPAQHNSGELFMTPDNVEQGGYLNRDDVLRALRKAGITLKVGGEDAQG